MTATLLRIDHCYLQSLQSTAGTRSSSSRLNSFHSTCRCAVGVTLTHFHEINGTVFAVFFSLYYCRNTGTSSIRKDIGTAGGSAHRIEHAHAI